MRRRTILAVLACAGHLPAGEDDRRKKKKELDRSASRWNRIAARRASTPEDEFFRKNLPLLLAQAREAEPGSYLLGRYLEALDDLLDAAEEYEDSRNDDTTKKDTRQRAARDLERSYFRVQQADYFARQAKDPNKEEYVKTARRLYQQARAAYDAAGFARARRLADAAKEVTNALEALAQAAVPIPKPPSL